MRDAIQMMTISEFWEFAQLPENRDKRWELINGVPIEKGQYGNVEVVSPNDKEIYVFEKARSYLLAGTKMVWLIFPENQTVYVCTLASEHRMMVDRYEQNMTLSGGEILPHFSLEIARIFPNESE